MKSTNPEFIYVAPKCSTCRYPQSTVLWSDRQSDISDCGACGLKPDRYLKVDPQAIFDKNPDRDPEQMTLRDKFAWEFVRSHTNDIDFAQSNVKQTMIAAYECADRMKAARDNTDSDVERLLGILDDNGFTIERLDGQYYVTGGKQ